MADAFIGTTPPAPRETMVVPIAASGSGRLVSLDAFRGFAVASMILVNNPGDWNHVYRQLDHAPWNGATFTDCIFPFFLFICGVTMAISIERRRAAGFERAAMFRQFALRSVVIFAIGLALNFIPAFDPATLRIPGVLQRIALCILLATPLLIWDGRDSRDRGGEVGESPWRSNLPLSLWIFALLAAYSFIQLVVPVPGADGRVGAGVLEPGRDAGAWLDRWLLDGHLWSQSKTWDPEGLLSTLPALCTLLFGVLCGRRLLASPTVTRTTVEMIVFGLASLAAGLVLEATLMPINKNLWTPSYCLFMNGWALLAFGAFYWLLDGNGSPGVRAYAGRLMKPLTIYGINALFLFALSGLIGRAFAAVRIAQADGTPISLKAWLYAPLSALPLDPATASLTFAIVFDLAMFAVAWLMWRKRWLIRT